MTLPVLVPVHFLLWHCRQKLPKPAGFVRSYVTNFIFNLGVHNGKPYLTLLPAKERHQFCYLAGIADLFVSNLVQITQYSPAGLSHWFSKEGTLNKLNRYCSNHEESRNKVLWCIEQFPQHPIPTPRRSYKKLLAMQHVHAHVRVFWLWFFLRLLSSLVEQLEEPNFETGSICPECKQYSRKRMECEQQ